MTADALLTDITKTSTVMLVTETLVLLCICYKFKSFRPIGHFENAYELTKYLTHTLKEAVLFPMWKIKEFSDLRTPTDFLNAPLHLYGGSCQSIVSNTFLPNFIEIHGSLFFVTCLWASIGSGHGLAPTGTQPLYEPMMIQGTKPKWINKYLSFVLQFIFYSHFGGLVQERHNALELCLSCTNPLIWKWEFFHYNSSSITNVQFYW